MATATAMENYCAKPPNVAIYDLEATGLEEDSQITQISVKLANGVVFNRYVRPTIDIPDRVVRLTGIQIRGDKMYADGKPVPSVPIAEALKDMAEFLPASKVTLTAHYGDRFDHPKLVRNIKACGLIDDFRAKVKGFADTWIFFKKIWYCHSYSQENLAKAKLSSNLPYKSHNAIDDVHVLQLLFEKAMQDMGPTDKQEIPASTFDYVLRKTRKRPLPQTHTYTGAKQQR